MLQEANFFETVVTDLLHVLGPASHMDAPCGVRVDVDADIGRGGTNFLGAVTLDLGGA